MLGDILTSTIIADQLKKEHPDCIIHYLIKSNAVPVVQGHPSIDKLVLVESKDFNSYYRLRKLAKTIRACKYDALIDVYGKNNSAILSALSKIPMRIGYTKWFSPFSYTSHIKNVPEDFGYENGSSIVSRLMLTIPFTRKIDWTLRPKIYLTEKEISDGKKWLLNNEASLNKRITMVSVLGSSNNKTLPFSYLAELLDRYVSETNSQLLFNYIPDQKNEALAIFQKCKEKTKSNILIDAFAPSLRDFLKVVVHCDAVIGNEGGAINMAKALSTPTYAIFSPWIEKHAWNNDEDGEKHIAIHLSDVLPSMIKGVKISRLKKDTVKLYKEFKPELIWPSLQTFIQRNSLDSEIDSKRSS